MLRTFSRLLFLSCLTLFLLGSSSLQAEVEDLNTQMLRATVKLSHSDSTGTGFILTPDQGKNFLLVTANHVLDKTTGNETTIIFRSKVAEGEYKKLPTKLSIRKDEKALWTKHPSEDVAVIAVTPPEGADLALVSTDLLATDEELRQTHVHPGKQIVFLGYPHREEASEAGFPILRDGPIATFPLLPTQKTKTFYVSSDIFSGDSGGPVYTSRPDSTAPMIMGVVHGQRFVHNTVKGDYITVKTHHQFGLAIVVHASFIIETIGLMK
ncbi:trypsin-like serine peptidase [Bremerella sp. P1]|uniref:trypsin-like serine peptidase n=1 Tax=Bremerella sp. P1 TaxID=3026424 RepID=UPI002368F2ED|nr:serine protease [Bremerella sp. P1]WDI41388.1 serine protease [Bremerella sp. P1]